MFCSANAGGTASTSMPVLLQGKTTGTGTGDDDGDKLCVATDAGEATNEVEVHGGSVGDGSIVVGAKLSTYVEQQRFSVPLRKALREVLRVMMEETKTFI